MTLPMPDPRLGTKPIFRFAPSPNGPLHRGHALSALLNADLAQQHDGVFLLRIEDIDPARSKPEHIVAIEDALGWLGLTWPKPVRRQSEHLADYSRALDRLEQGGFIYPCFCQRRTLADTVVRFEGQGGSWPRDPDGAPVYDGACKMLTPAKRAQLLGSGEPYQWRLDMKRALDRTGPLHWHAFDPRTGAVQRRGADPIRWGDPVIARKDVPTSYHLAVVVDDALQGITHIVRGADLEAATDIHVVLQYLLDLPQPLYWHHPLVRDEDGRKLAKSKGSLSLQTERAQGLTADSLRAQARDLLQN